MDFQALGELPPEMLDQIWDHPMVTQFLFPNRDPGPADFADATSGPIRDGTFEVSGGVKISYRLYVPADVSKVKTVVYFFHGKDESVRSMDSCASTFHANGAAILTISYRGFCWGTGTPSLLSLCSDAEQCFEASLPILDSAGLSSAKRVMHAFSIGATCAVHLASTQGSKIHGLIVESGLMSVKTLPMVAMIAPMIFQSDPSKFDKLSEPFKTLENMPTVSCPTLVIHGNQDEVVPYAQAEQCYKGCGASKKRLRMCPNAGHCNGRQVINWDEEIKAFLDLVASGGEEAPIAYFPQGVLVEAHSLSTEAFNGMQGRAVGTSGERIRVQFLEPNGEKTMKPANLRIISPRELKAENASLVSMDDFPVGIEVEAHSLSVAELNGARGKVVRHVREKERVEVEFDAPHGKKALKPANLHRIAPGS